MPVWHARRRALKRRTIVEERSWQPPQLLFSLDQTNAPVFLVDRDDEVLPDRRADVGVSEIVGKGDARVREGVAADLQRLCQFDLPYPDSAADRRDAPGNSRI